MKGVVTSSLEIVLYPVGSSIEKPELNVTLGIDRNAAIEFKAYPCEER